MNKFLIIAVVIAVTAGIVVLTSLGNQKDAVVENNDSPEGIVQVGEAPKDEVIEKTEVMKESADAMMAEASFVDYSATAVAEAQAAGKRPVLFFYATWCSTCKAAEKDLIANASLIPKDVVIFKTNYDTEKTLKNKYGLTSQHTFVQIDADGEAVAIWNGGETEELLDRIR